MRWLVPVSFALAAVAASAWGAPGWSDLSGRDEERAILKEWDAAGPEERRTMGSALERVDRERRFVDARPVVIPMAGKLVSLADLFLDILEPALATAPLEETGRAEELGLRPIHRQALFSLQQLREVFAAPRAVGSGTLNLMLGYAHAALTAPDLTPRVRLRFFNEILRNVRDLEGRAVPDGRSRWLLRQRLLPALLGLARSNDRDPLVREAVSEAASLLYSPTLLSARGRARLAPLTRGSDSRRVLLAAYRNETLDQLGLESLASSVVMEARDDPAFLSGAAPVLLELLSDPAVRPADRLTVLQLISERFAAQAPLRATALELLAAGFGGPPRTMEVYGEEFTRHPRGVARPESERRFRFLSIVLVQRERNLPPQLARVVRRDAALYERIRNSDSGGDERFLGVLLPADVGDHADFLGPPPGLSGARDNRLLRRTLRLERIAIETYGAHGEVIELCVALPEDASEPVPAKGASLSHVVELLRSRLGRTDEDEERREIVALLVRIGTDEANALAIEQTDSLVTAREILPLAERGSVAAGLRVARRIEAFPLEEREGVLHGLLRKEGSELFEVVLGLARHQDPGVACLAADALLAHGDARGVLELLRHPDVYARACGGSLALRLTSLDRNLQVMPGDRAIVDAVAAEVAKAFASEKSAWWPRYGKWLARTFEDANQIENDRRDHVELRLGEEKYLPSEYAEINALWVREGKHKGWWPKLVFHLLAPRDPGLGLPEEGLAELLDALEERATDGLLQRLWIDSLVILACVQQGMESGEDLLRVAQARLERAAGGKAPVGTRRKPGVYWPIWRSRQVAGR